MNKYLKLKTLTIELEKEKSYLERYNIEFEKMKGNIFSKRNLNRTNKNIKLLELEIIEEKELILKRRDCE